MIKKINPSTTLTLFVLCLSLAMFSACPVATESDSKIAELTKKIEENPNDAATYHKRGKVYFNKKEFTKSVADYKKALRCEPERMEAVYDRACAYIEMEEWDKALKDLNRYLSDPANEKSFKAYERRGYVHLRKGNYKRAIKECNTAIKLNPGYFPAITTKGKAQKAKASQE